MDDVTPSAERPRRRFCKLRIALSIACGIIYVLLIALWVRSYEQGYGLRASDAGTGVILFVEHGVMGVTSPGLPTWSLVKLNAGAFAPGRNYRTSGFMGFHIGSHPSDRSYLLLQIPLWFVMLLVATICALPSIRCSSRFSLRTLLIATTLIAVVLGVIGYTVQ